MSSWKDLSKWKNGCISPTIYSQKQRKEGVEEKTSWLLEWESQCVCVCVRECDLKASWRFWEDNTFPALHKPASGYLYSGMSSIDPKLFSLKCSFHLSTYNMQPISWAVKKSNIFWSGAKWCPLLKGSSSGIRFRNENRISWPLNRNTSTVYVHWKH